MSSLRVVGGLLIALSSLAVAVEPSERFVQKVALPSGHTAVVAEGDFEARSTGSYRVRLGTGSFLLTAGTRKAPTPSLLFVMTMSLR